MAVRLEEAEAAKQRAVADRKAGTERLAADKKEWQGKVWGGGDPNRTGTLTGFWKKPARCLRLVPRGSTGVCRVASGG